MNFEDVPWTYALPALVVFSFGTGLAYKRLQDHTVRVLRHATKPVPRHVESLTQAAKTLGKTSQSTDLGYS